MHSFGLSKEFCLEFLRKQCTIANLKPGKLLLNVQFGNSKLKNYFPLILFRSNRTFKRKH